MAVYKNKQIKEPNSVLFIDPSQVNIDLFIQGVVSARKEGTQIFVLGPGRFMSKRLIEKGAVVNQSDDLESNELLVFNPGPYIDGEYYSRMYDEQVKEVVEYIRLKTNYPLTPREMDDLQAAVETMYKIEGIDRTSYRPTTINRESVLATDCLLFFIKAKNESLYKIIRDYGSFKKNSSSELQRLFAPHLPKLNLDKNVCLFDYTGIPTSRKSMKGAYFESLCMIQRKVRTTKQKAVVILNTRFAIDFIDLFKDSEGLITYIVLFEGKPIVDKSFDDLIQNFRQILIAKPLGLDAETLCSYCKVPKKMKNQLIYQKDELSDDVLMITRKNDRNRSRSYFVGKLFDTIDVLTKGGLL